MITITAASTGVFATTQGRHYVLSTTGPIAPQTLIKTSYALSGATGVYNGFLMEGRNFSEPFYAPGGYLKVELVNATDYDAINIELVASTIA